MLVIAASGRILAQAAHRAGKPVRVMDRYGDLDTRAAAGEVKVEPLVGDRTAGPALMEAIDRFSPISRGESVVWGGGLEGQAELLEQLAERREVLGNSGEQVRLVKDPGSWTALLSRLDLPYPETRREPPADGAGWLSKMRGASGGWHIRPADAEDAGANRYFQRQAAGAPHSVLFVADGERARILGITEQWTGREQSGSAGDFRYGGALSHAPLAADVARGLTEAVSAITAAVGLRGLNGLDFVTDGRELQLLEVNPRPVATLDLYREGLNPSPFLLHLSGSRGSLPHFQAQPPGVYRGHAVVYAEESVRIPQGLLEHPWCGDRAPGGTFFPEGAPVCTVHARHADREQTRRQLWRRHRWIREQLRQAPVSEPAFSA
ncbi:ATP-grasp domain-containing protein [Thiohalorhabdus methylotrophus]|uniref:ATP-grasp domain-containing protein n=1 Tax=Thiohalorhabdus methylotrophus TaxID=3242694 RepID=A0ABV4TV40_9GAMM